MAERTFTTPSIPVNSKLLNGGLNTTAGPIALEDNESSDLQNIDFDKFGSIIKRGGYTVLNTTATSGTNLRGDGLYWYQFNNAGTNTRYLTHVTGGKLLGDLGGVSGTWTTITGAITTTALSHCDFETFINKVFITNGNDVPIYWDGSTTANNLASVLPTGMTTAKYVRLFNNYLFVGNVVVSGTYYPNRIYWSNVRDPFTWLSQNWIDVAKEDGDEITGLRVLSDRLIIYKNRSIYNLFFTGDADIPFILPGGGKTNSVVGSVAPWSIQEVNNGHVFLSYDGIYYFDGNNSYRISNKIRTTLLGYSLSNFKNAVSCVYRSKGRYLLGISSAGSGNDMVVVWDFNNAFNNSYSLYAGSIYNSTFGLYKGLSCADMAQVFNNGIEERVYFSDYSGYTYRQDVGSSDYPLNVKTAISAYYYTNWKTFDDLVDQKGVLRVVVYYQQSSATLTFAYSYDFQSSDQFITSFNTSSGSANWGSFLWGGGSWGGSGGAYQRIDLDGRGRSLRVKFANSNPDETFRIDGLGLETHLETDAG